jgi:regulator of sigma E protease
MEFINTVFYFIIVIGILVFIHELGHFLAARAMGMRADVFALGMGPRILGYNKKTGFSFGKISDDLDLEGDTDYRICAFPIGGYVKVAGMVDESMDKEFINSEPQPWEYRSKPVWKRMVVITAGVIMNIILAFAIFYTINLVRGKSYVDTTTVGYVKMGSPAEVAGLEPGDKIVSINNKPVEYWDNIVQSIKIDNLGENLSFIVNRNGQDTVLSIDKAAIGDMTQEEFGLFPEKMSPVITAVESGKPAGDIGLAANDVVTSFAGQTITNQQQLIDLIRSNAGKEVEIAWLRDGQTMTGKITPAGDSTIGVGIAGKYEGPVKTLDYNVISAIPKAGYDMYYYGIEVFFGSMAKIFSGDIAFNKAIGGPIKIAQVSAQSAEGGFFTFISFIALLSMSLAIINILPFPALDGGHFMMLCYEGIARKPVPFKVQVVLQNVGFGLLLLLMLFVIYNDIISL